MARSVHDAADGTIRAMLSEIAAFSVAELVITLTPGADMALVARRALTHGYGTAGRTSLVSIHIAMGVVWPLTWAWLVSRARAQFLRLRWRATLERVTGAVLVGLGVRLAAARR
jgi:threonine/homoserine/homoserine lactone efflux protein